jgi:hypothetical protein
MKYMLVMQFAGDSEKDFEALIGLEDQLTQALPEDAEVDGHDIGSGQGNIFIFTDNPQSAFDAARPVLQKARRLNNATVAYREGRSGPSDQNRSLRFYDPLSAQPTKIP